MQNLNNIQTRIIDVFQNESSTLTNALNIINSIQSSYELFKKSDKQQLKLIQFKQVGGKREKYEYNNDKYYYNVESSKPLNSQFKNNEIQLLTVNEGLYGCGLILLNNDTNEARIQSVSNYQECIECSNPDANYKVGDIMMQIIINICKKTKN